MDMNEAEKRVRAISPSIHPSTLMYMLQMLGLSPTGRRYRQPVIQQPAEVSEKRDPISVIRNQPRRRKRRNR